MIQPETDPARRKRQAAALAWLLVTAWAVVIFAMSAKSGLDLDTDNSIVSIAKRWLTAVLSQALGRPVDVSPIGHFTEYLVFGALLTNAFRHHMPVGKAALCAVAAGALYAVTDEIHQIFVPGRACDPLDWLVDVAALALSALIVWLVLRRRRTARGDS